MVVTIKSKSSKPPPGTTTIATAKLKPYPNNPRDNDAAVDQMCASIDEFGFCVPVLVKGLDVVDGHLRLKAALKMGIAEVPVYDVSHMTAEQVKAFRILVNRSVDWADWDNAKLVDELRSLASGMDDDLARLANMSGFSAAEVNALLYQAPMNLDDLEAQHGTHQDGDIWPEVKISVSPEIKLRFDAIMEVMEGDTELQRFSALLDAVEAGTLQDA